MISVLSATGNEFYSYPLPITVWSWYKLGIKSIVFVPENSGAKIALAKEYCNGMADFYTFKCEERKEATFAQTSRLFGATVEGLDDNEVLITGDADLAVFGSEFEQFKDGKVRIIGADLLSEDMNQFPMCFIGMSVSNWKDIFAIGSDNLQSALDDTVGNLESISFRGDFWGYDQWYAHQVITRSGVDILKIPRAKPPEMFAVRRYDRDDQFILDRLNPDTIDFHMPRPGYEEKSHHIIMTILKYHYPNEDFTWVDQYRNEYLKLL